MKKDNRVAIYKKPEDRRKSKGAQKSNQRSAEINKLTKNFAALRAAFLSFAIALINVETGRFHFLSLW